MALEMALSYGPDLVLLDVKMPQMSGIEVCKKIKTDEKTKNCIVIMLSAKAQSKEIEAGLEAGADRYLCKPIGFPDILNEINNFDVKGN
jgi:DNA-binding response OmpR family regulator